MSSRKNIRILYLSYWGLNEGLTYSSVLPHLRILSEKEYISELYFLTVERTQSESLTFPPIDKVTHFPLFSKNFPIGLINKINDILLFRNQIVELIKKEKIDVLICRTSLAGAIGYLVHQKTGTPFIVESFEPHADYMVDGHIWKKNGFKYRFQKHWEKKILSHAQSVVTVSRHFSKKISAEFHGEVHTFGCAVDAEAFRFYEKNRQQIRINLGWENQLIGIYVGKFGSIYYDQKAFRIFKAAFDHFGDNFRLIILSPNNHDEINASLQSIGVPLDRVSLKLVPHAEVSAYLSAADFAFSMVRPSPVRLYCSPIKDGEYWANGLPVLSGHDIGEDSELIEKYHAGALFSDDLSDLAQAFRQIKLIMESNDRIGSIAQVAIKYRSFTPLSGLYDQLLNG